MCGREFIRRHRRGLGLAAIVLAAVVVLSAVLVVPYSPGPSSGVGTAVVHSPFVSSSTSKACSAVTTCTTSGITITKGDSTYIIVSSNSTSAPSGESDSAGHGYTSKKTKTEVNARLDFFVSTAFNLAAGTGITATVTFAASTSYVISFGSISAIPYTTVVDATCTGTTGISTSPTDSVTTVTAGDLILSGWSIGSASTISYGGSASQINDTSVSTLIQGAVASVVDASTGSFTQTATLGTKSYWAECAMAIKPGSVPTAPTSVSATATTNVQITLGWTNPVGTVLNDTVYQWTGSACSGTPTIVSTGGSATSQAMTSLLSATEYCFQVEAWNSTGNSAFSTAYTAWTLPTHPTGLSSTSNTYYSVTLGWTNPSGTLNNSFMYWNSGASCSGTTAVKIGSAATSGTVSGLSGSTQYSFEVTAWSAGGQSTVSTCIQVTTNADPAPGAPTSYALGAITTRTVATSWAQPSGGGILNDTAYTQTASGACAAVHTGHNLGVVTSYTFSTTAGTYVCEEVAAWNVTGQGTLTSVLSTATLSDAATGLTVASVTTTSISLTWTNPAGGALSNATVYSATSCSPASWTGHSVGSAATSYTVTSLVSATGYCFRVQIWTTGGGSNQSATASGTTLPTSATSLATGSLTTTTAAVSWTNPSGTIANDTVFWQTGSACSGYPTGHSLGSAGTSYTITGLTTNTTYCWTVMVWSAGGAASLPAGVIFHTGGVPWRVTGVTLVPVTAATTHLTLSWTVPSQDAGFSNQTFYLTGGSSCSGSLLATINYGTGSSPYTITGLIANTQYGVTIQIWNATGASPQTGCVSATTSTVPGHPTGLTTGTLTTTTAVVSWTNPGGGGLLNDTVAWESGTACSGYTSTHSLGSAGTTYTITGLTTGNYCWSVQAWNATGASGYSTGVTFTIGTVPSAPTGLTYVSATTAHITLTWTNPTGSLSNETVYYQTGSSCTTGTGVSTGGNVSTFTVTGLAGATIYSFTVQAWNTIGGSAQSSCATGATLGAIPPAPSTPVTTGVGFTWTTIAWTNPTGYTILNNSLMWKWGQSCGAPWNVSTSLGGPTTSANLTGLGKGQHFCVQVVAWDAQSPPSNPLIWATQGVNPGCGGACEGGGGGGNYVPPVCITGCPVVAPNATTPTGINFPPLLAPWSPDTAGIGLLAVVAGSIVTYVGKASVVGLGGVAAIVFGAFFLLVFFGVL